MKTSKRGALEIIAHEGVVTSRYKCPADVWTIGVGVTRAAGADIDPETYEGTITLQEAIDLFWQILPKYEAIVNGLLGGRRVEQHEYDALVSLSYNAGNINQPKTRRLARSGRVVDAINLWRANPILKKRRDAEAALAASGEYKATHVTEYPADKDGNVLWKWGRDVPVEIIA